MSSTRSLRRSRPPSQASSRRPSWVSPASRSSHNGRQSTGNIRRWRAANCVQAMARVLIIPLALLGMLLGAIVWSGGGVEKRATFAFINRGDIYTLDLNQMSYMQDFRLTYAIREGLYSPQPVTLTPIPAGATGHDLSADKRVWTFHLRKECRWSNGDPVTAHDYVFSWRHMLDEPGEYTYLFYYIKGAKEFSQQLQIYFAYEDQIASYEKDPLKYIKAKEEYDTA